MLDKKKKRPQPKIHSCIRHCGGKQSYRQSNTTSMKQSQKDLASEFIKENKKVRKQENKNSTKTATKKREKKNFLDYFLGRVLVFLFSCYLTFFYKFPPLDGQHCQVIGTFLRCGSSPQSSLLSFVWVVPNRFGF